MVAVLRLEAAPDHVHGYVSRFLQEVLTGLYVGRVSKRVSAAMWQRIVTWADGGAACMVVSADNEAGYEIWVHGHDRVAVWDMDGVPMPAVTPRPEKQDP